MHRSRSPGLTARSWSDAIAERMPGIGWFQSADGAGPAVESSGGGSSTHNRGAAGAAAAGTSRSGAHGDSSVVDSGGRVGGGDDLRGGGRGGEGGGGRGGEEALPPDRLTRLKDLFNCETIEIDAGAFNGVVFSTWDNILGPVYKLVWISKQADLSDRFHEKLLPFIPSCTL